MRREECLCGENAASPGNAREGKKEYEAWACRVNPVAGSPSQYLFLVLVLSIRTIVLALLLYCSPVNMLPHPTS